MLGYFVRHPTAANLLMAMMILAGLAALTQIRAQFFPDIVVEQVTVRVAWDGAGPSDVDAAIIEALEPAIRAVDGVESTRTLAREGLGSIIAELETGADLSAAVEAITAAVEGATTLPDDADAPEIVRGRYRDRVTNVILSGGAPVSLLAEQADALTAQLFRAGVSRLTVEGAPSPRVLVELSPEALERHGLTLQRVAEAIAGQSAAAPAGGLGEGGARVRAGVDRRTLEELGAVALRSGVDGGVLRLRDVARLAPDLETGQKAYFTSGQPALEIRVDRDAEGDAIAIQRTVERVVARFNEGAPQGVEATLTRTRAQAIIDRLDILVRNGVTGLAIVLGLLFLFLSARTAFWVAAGIPAAMLATIGLMYVAGLSLNMISLFALIICLGIVVDDAIVVGEHADTLARRGLSPGDAATQAAQRMAAPVFSASITTIIAFLALIVVGGRFGSLIGDLPKTVAVVILASLIECFVILPAHMRHALAAKAKEAWYDAPSRAVNRGFRWVRDKGFRPFMTHAIRWRYPLLFIALALLIHAISMFHDRSVRWRFFSAPERGTLVANIAMAESAERADTRAMLEEMRRALEATDAAFAEEHGAAPVVFAVAVLGDVSGRGLAAAETKGPDLLGSFQIELIDPDLRPYSAFEFIRAWRREIAPTPLLETLAVRGERSGPSGDAIDISLEGDLPAAELKAAAEDLKSRLAALEGVSALEDSLPYDKPELTLDVTPKGRALGFDGAEIAGALRAQLEGAVAARFAISGEEAEVLVRLPREAVTPAFLETARLPIPTGGASGEGGGAATAPLSEIAEIEERQGFASIRRLDGARIAQVTGEVAEDAATRNRVAAALEEEILPEIEAVHGIRAVQGGLAEQERRFLGDAFVGVLLCLAGIYLTLTWVFASWTRPLVVMAIIPFGMIGVIWGHYWHGVPLSMFSVVGLLGMIGIIVNDSIVLITTIDQEAKRRPLREAVADGAAARLRAVFLTTVTTVGGLTPLLFETSRQALFLKPTVITLAYGLGFGMLIVLLITPALVMLQHDTARRLRAARRIVAHLGRRRPSLGSPRRAR